MRNLIRIWGWGSMVGIVVGYFLLSAGYVTAANWEYHAINLFSSLGIMADSGMSQAWPGAVLNVIMSGIAIVSLWQILV